MKNEVEKLLQKQMDRKDFLKHVAVGFAAIVGITTLLKTVMSLNGSKKPESYGYGANTYGAPKSSTPNSQSKS